MHIWTFIIEHGNGSTLVTQVKAEDLDSSVVAFNASQHAKEHCLVFPSIDNQGEFYEYHSPTPIEGTRNVWCLGSPENVDAMFLANVVKTCP